MSTIHKVAKNTAVTMVGNLIFRLLSLIVVIYLARYLGVEDFGKYNFVFAYLGFFAIITDLGLGDILVREMSRDSERMPIIFGNAYIIKIFLSLIAISLAMLTISLMGYSAETAMYIYAASIIMLFQSFSDIYGTVFQTTFNMKYDVASKLIFKTVSAFLILYVIIIQGTLFQIIFVLVFSELLKALLNYAFSKKCIKANFNVDFKMWKFLFKESLPIALSGVFFLIYHRIDVLMLSMIKGDLAVGMYSAAYKLSEPLGLFPYAIIISLFPIMSRSFKNSRNSLIKSYEVGFKCLIILMLPMALGTMLISEKIILLIYDQSYTGSITALQILVWSIFLTALNFLFTSLLTSINKQKLNTLSMGVCVAINILLNIILIPQFSYNGASVATVLTELILLILSLYFVSTNLDLLPLHRISIKPITACLIMGVPVYYLTNFTDVNLFLIIIFAFVVYLMALLGMNTFSSDEKTIFRKFLKI